MNKTPNPDSDSTLVIQKMSMVHCARGPKNCERCKEMAKEQHYCLLKLLPGGGMETRPVIGIEVDGAMQYYEYDLVQIFTGKKEAMDYASEHDIRVVNSAGK
jgi:hypothetical protein